MRQLGLFAFAAVAGLAALMWGLNLLANLTASASGANSAVDAANNAITVLLREEPQQLALSHSQCIQGAAPKKYQSTGRSHHPHPGFLAAPITPQHQLSNPCQGTGGPYGGIQYFHN